MAETPRLWGDKRYHNWNFHLRQIFGQKVFKVSIDAGFDCPNRDGTLGQDGCIFCSPSGSGDFAGRRSLDISKQFDEVREKIHTKWPEAKYIAYFQAFSNTYAPVHELRAKFEEALSQPNVIGLSIATRPDCLPDTVLNLLEEVNAKTYLWLELGLQSVHDKTLQLINRGHDYQTFLQALYKLRQRDIRTCAHIILGLPGESRDEMLYTGMQVAKLPLQGIKLHLLHLLKGTPMEKLYKNGQLSFFDRAAYTSLVAEVLEHLPPEMVIQRLTGDGPPDLLLEPQWSRKKWEVLNGIDSELTTRNTWQGRLFAGN